MTIKLEVWARISSRMMLIMKIVRVSWVKMMTMIVYNCQKEATMNTCLRVNQTGGKASLAKAAEI